MRRRALRGFPFEPIRRSPAGLETVRLPHSRLRNNWRENSIADKPANPIGMRPPLSRVSESGADSWNGTIVVPEPAPDPASPRPVTIEHAITTFLAELQETIASGTHKKYLLLLTKFKEFSNARGYVMIDPDLREFRTSRAIN